MKFNQISIVGISSLDSSELKVFQELSINPIFHIADSTDFHWEKIPKNTDALLVSLLIEVNPLHIKNFPDLKYIGVYGSSFRRINPEILNDPNLQVTCVRHYCDKVTADFSLGIYFQKFPSLNGTLGVIGFGDVGSTLARLANEKDIKVIYYSSSRRGDLDEENKIDYFALPSLLNEADVISVHVPPHLNVINKKMFKEMPDSKTLISTSIGEVFDKEALVEYLARSPANEVYFDSVAGQSYQDLKMILSLHIEKKPAYKSPESMQKLKDTLIKNLRNSHILSDYVVKDFESQHSESVLKINQDEVPRVSELDSESLFILKNQCFYFKVIVSQEEVLGFLIALREGQPYESENYLWFQKRLSHFIYIDRVVVDQKHRGKGIARRFYDDLIKTSSRLNIPLACEVNIFPPNLYSYDFHKGLGFREEGTQFTSGGSKKVALLMKRPSEK